MIHVYAFASGVGELPEGTESIDVLGVTAVFGRNVGDAREDVVRHGLVVESLAEAADAVLPARFGERFAGVAALEAAVAGRAPELSARLAAVAGCVELAVRVARVPRTARGRAASGGDYMRLRLREASEDDAVVSELRSLLEPRARAATVAEPSPVRLLHDAGYLVDRSEVPAFTASVEAYAAAHPELAVVCTGPWAPAGFAGAA